MFFEKTGKYLYKDVPLAALSSFKIGGPADLFYEAKTSDELRETIGLAIAEKQRFIIIGGGTNILFDDEGYRGLIVKNSASACRKNDEKLVVSSGTSLTELLQIALAFELSGLEFLAGIPGTVGGALYGNAGAFNQSIGDCVRSVSVLKLPDIHNEIKLGHEDLNFSYRHSRFKTRREIILEAEIMIAPGEKREIEDKMKKNLEHREKKHPPWGTACAGSYFKNPTGPDGRRVAAGALLDRAGARGLSVGAASVYENHCNFIINRGGAKARDVLELADRLKRLVFKDSGLELEEEVIYLSPEASIV